MYPLRLLHRNNVILFIKKWNIAILAFVMVDLMIITLGFQVAYHLCYFGYHRLFIAEKSCDLLFFFMIPVWILLFHLNLIAQIPRTIRYSRILKDFMRFFILNLLALSLFSYIIQDPHLSVFFVLTLAFIIFVFLYLVRLAEYRLFKLYRALGYNYKNVIIFADGSAQRLIDNFLYHKEWGYRILLILSDDPVIREKYQERLKIYPENFLLSMEELMRHEIVDEVFYHKINPEIPQVRNLLKSCEEVGIELRLFTHTVRYLMTNAQKTYIGNIPYFTFTHSNNYYYGASLKTIIDIFASVSILMLLAPFLLILAVLIKLDSGGPVIFKQVRVGLNGRYFNLYKFRTMVRDAEAQKKNLMDQNEMEGPVFKIKKDPRITKIGRKLRKSGLDELPQFFNVLKGDMSLIGPRPPIPSEIAQYERCQLRRLSVKPGITCFWQIIPERNTVNFENWIRLDLEYLEGWSPKMDTKLFFKTIRSVFTGSGS